MLNIQEIYIKLKKVSATQNNDYLVDEIFVSAKRKESRFTPKIESNFCIVT